MSVSASRLACTSSSLLVSGESAEETWHRLVGEVCVDLFSKETEFFRMPDDPALLGDDGSVKGCVRGSWAEKMRLFAAGGGSFERRKYGQRPLSG